MAEFLKPITIKCAKRILEQAENSFYEINTCDSRIGIGIFCHIKYENGKIPILITNIDMITEENYKNGIKVSINNIYKNILLGNVKYKNKEYNTIIIEIQENEKDNINFLEIDDIFFENESERFYYKESIYLIHINNQNDVLISYNIIHDVNNSEIFYHYKINIKYKYSFIFNLSNNKIIGIYNKNYNKYDKGLLFNFMINEFMKKYKELKKLKNIMCKYENNIKNEIEIKAKIEEKDIGKEIYFLDDKYYDFKEEKYIFCRDHLKELNELNTELIINNKKYEYKKFFIS